MPVDKPMESAALRTCGFATCSNSNFVETARRKPLVFSDSRRRPVFEISEGTSTRGPSVADIAKHKPSALIALIPSALVLFTAGAVAGALGKTITAPLDRLKILMQVKGAMAGGAIQAAAGQGNLLKAFLAIGQQEGIPGYWKGNLPQVLRVIPYSAAQLYGYEMFKGMLTDADNHLSVERRLLAGACAGMFSTLLTYPLDTLRLRLAVDPTLKSIPAAVQMLQREGGVSAFFRGLGPAVVGIAPYMALELGSYDSLPQEYPPFARGFTAALIATSVCYPLDTIRRQIQLNSVAGVKMMHVIRTCVQEEGVRGFYRGFLPNALKNLPNKGIRLSVFDAAKTIMARSNTEYEAFVKEWNGLCLGSVSKPLVRRV